MGGPGGLANLKWGGERDQVSDAAEIFVNPLCPNSNLDPSKIAVICQFIRVTFPNFGHPALSSEF